MGESKEIVVNWFKISQYHNQDLQREIRSLKSELEKYKTYEIQIKEKDNTIKKLQNKLNAQPKKEKDPEKDKYIEELEEMNEMLSIKVKNYAAACLLLKNENKTLQANYKKLEDDSDISRRDLESVQGLLALVSATCEKRK
jgi:chromosome segregation ATPase